MAHYHGKDFKTLHKVVFHHQHEELAAEPDSETQLQCLSCDVGLEDQCTLLSNEDFVPTYRPAGLVGDNNVNTQAAASYTPHGHTHTAILTQIP